MHQMSNAEGCHSANGKSFQLRHHFQALRSGLLMPSAACHITSDWNSSTGTPLTLAVWIHFRVESR